jgi:large subunit ribosomal protein L21
MATATKQETYAVVEVGGNQHRVSEGDFILTDRLEGKEGAKVALKPLMLRGAKDVVIDAKGLEKVKVEATIRGHERGEKIRVFKFKPKRGYKKTQGHRQELTRLEVTKITPGAASAAAKKPAAEKPAAKAEDKPAAEKKPAAKKPAAKKTEE